MSLLENRDDFKWRKALRLVTKTLKVPAPAVPVPACQTAGCEVRIMIVCPTSLYDDLFCPCILRVRYYYYYLSRPGQKYI